MSSRSGMQAQFTTSGVLRRLDVGDRSLLMYPADELEAGPANLYLRIRGVEGAEAVAMMGPGSDSTVSWSSDGPTIVGTWRDLQYTVTFRLAGALTAWYWHVLVTSLRPDPTEIDLIYAQDLALAPYAAVRACEYYVSQYLDLTPVETSTAGTVLAVRQNMPGPTAAWAVVGCLTEGVGWGTDALQLVGRAHHAGAQPVGLSANDLPSTRLQHEHTLALLQSRPVQLAGGETAATGFFGAYQPDHPAATSGNDKAAVDEVLGQPEARQPQAQQPAYGLSPESPSVAAQVAASSLFSSASALACTPLDDDQLARLGGEGRQHAEWDGVTLLSYFTDDGSHVVTSAKQAAVLRPHGHVMRTGTALVPDEGSLTTTAWMAGTFHSQVTQGHVSLNRMLSTRRSYLGLRQAQGLRIFVESLDAANGWTLLDEPSAWAVSLDSCRWWYAHKGGLLEVASTAPAESHELGLAIRVLSGPPVRLLICAHVALGGDDGQDPEPPLLEHDDEGVTVRPLEGSLTSTRFPAGSFRFSWKPGTIDQVCRDEALFLDGQSRELPWITMRTTPCTEVHLALTADLVPAADLARQDLVGLDDLGETVADPDLADPDLADPDLADPDLADPDLGNTAQPQFWDGISSLVRLTPPADSPLAEEVSRLDAVLPWFAHDALVHYLSPRGLEQSTGGAWGTRDVCQGPVGLLIALGQTAPLRDLIVRVLRAQNARGDWPQSFEFYPRELRGGQGDAHGDVIFWPVLALGEYLAVTGDVSLFAERIPFVDDDGATAGEPMLEHVRRALAKIGASTVPGSPLPAYGHGDWNDSLQPADPLLAARLCSTWTATLQVQALRTLAASLRTVSSRLDGQDGADASEYADRSERIAGGTAEAMHTLLMRDGVLAGYGLFGDDGSIEHLVHPSDQRTGLSYGLLQVIHAISGDLLSPTEARDHLDVIDEHLLGPDGSRLFDRPARYHGGPMEVFQRAEASTFFGREIGIMYTHAHLRYAQALARHGDAERLLEALALVNPIGVTERVPNGRPRQSTCYYSSSDATFADRYEAAEHYGEVMAATVPFEGGWRVYSSGPGIFLRLVVECLLGVRRRGDLLELDPVLAPALDGLEATVPVDGIPLDLTFRVGDRGVGPVAVALNGVTLQTNPLSNPYRPAGVAIDMARVRAGMRTSGRNHLEIQVS
ncbi:MAG: GH36-type glycosyl hydrolase domain-containing protein [Dermatophilaceae bacterium]